jgi:hypothetical protein
MSAQLVTVLRGARDRLAVPGQWTKKHFARSADGDAVSCSSKDAVCWCVEGAIGVEASRLLRGGKDERGLYWAAISAAERLVPEVDRLFVFNDAQSSVEPVLALLDRAILEVEGC